MWGWRLLEEARSRVHVAIEAAERPAVACSFGADSVLVLALAREVRPDMEVLWLRDWLTKEQRAFPEQVIRDWELRVLGLGTTGQQLIGGEMPLRFGRQYVLNGEAVWTAHDFVPSTTRCVLDLRPSPGVPVALPFDVLLTGAKATDQDPLGRYDQEWLGNCRVIHPLWDFIGDSRAALSELGAPVPPSEKELDPSNIIACTNCLMDATLPCFKYESSCRSV